MLKITIENDGATEKIISTRACVCVTLGDKDCDTSIISSGKVAITEQLKIAFALSEAAKSILAPEEAMALFAMAEDILIQDN